MFMFFMFGVLFNWSLLMLARSCGRGKSRKARASDPVVDELAVGLVHAGERLIQEEEALVLVAPRQDVHLDVAGNLMPNFNKTPSESLLLGC